MDERTSGFDLRWALVVSLGVHLVLALVAAMLLALAGAATREPVPEKRIRFTFAPVTGRDLEGGRPPSPTPVPSAPVEPAAPAASPPAPSARRAAPSPPLPEPTSPPAPEPAATVTPPDPLEERAGRAAVEGSGELPPGAGRPLDVKGALREFGRAIANRPVNPSDRGPAGATGSATSNVFVPDLSSFPTTGFGMGNLTFESRDYDWSDYARAIYIAIWRAWHNRLLATTSDFEKWAHDTGQWFLNDQSQVRFVIERNGQVTGIVLEGSQGCFPLDRSAIDALAEVILPRLPDDFPREREVVHARFIAQGEIRSMRGHLTAMKRAGAF